MLLHFPLQNLLLMKKILTLQKCLVRLISNAHRISHADPLFHKRNILKIEDLYIQSLRTFTFNLYKNKLPYELSSIFTRITHGHNTRGAQNNLFVMRSSSQSIKSLAPKCWNSIPLEIRESTSIGLFKAKSKGDLVAHYATFTCKERHCQSCLVSASQTSHH